jgi:hypothetical protein
MTCGCAGAVPPWPGTSTAIPGKTFRSMIKAFVDAELTIHATLNQNEHQ